MSQLSPTEQKHHNATQSANADLDFQYQITVMKLHECALHEPGQDLQKDAEMDALENELLAIQEDILEQTAKVTVETVKDFKMVSSIWDCASGLKHKKYHNPIEQMAMSMHQYIGAKIS